MRRPVSPLSAFDRSLGRAHRFFFLTHPMLTLGASLAFYGFVFLAAGERLAVSANYFVLFPIIVAGSAWGFWGGLVAGALGLPANLLLFTLIGHPEYSPASKLIAELSGLLLGSTLGYLSDYFRRLEAEIARRHAVEEDLRRTLREKELLARELHHRVKNNLGVVKSIISLQSSRSSSADFKEESARLVRRVQAIALVHDLLHRSEDLGTIDPAHYLRTLASGLVAGQVDTGTALSLEVHIDSGGTRLGFEIASPLGLIANEAITNAIKYAIPHSATPRLVVSFERRGDRFHFAVEDSGPGYEPNDAAPSGLGTKLAILLSRQLKGEVRWIRLAQGTRFEFDFPVPKGGGDGAS